MQNCNLAVRMWGCAWGNGRKSPSGSGLGKQERSTPGGRGQHLPVPNSAVCKEMHAFVRAFSLLGCTLMWIPMRLQSLDRLGMLQWVLAGAGGALSRAPGAGVTWSRASGLTSTREEGSGGTRASGSCPGRVLPASLARFLLLRNSLCRGLCDGCSAPLPRRRQVVTLFRRRRFSRVSCRRSHFSS